MSDRHIPNRSGTFNADENFDGNASEVSEDASDHAKMLKEASDNRVGKSSRVLAFKNKAPAPVEGYQNSLKVLYSSQAVASKKDTIKPSRHINSAPIRILDAPDMLDDYCELSVVFCNKSLSFPYLLLLIVRFFPILLALLHISPSSFAFYRYLKVYHWISSCHFSPFLNLLIPSYTLFISTFPGLISS